MLDLTSPFLQQLTLAAAVALPVVVVVLWSRRRAARTGWRSVAAVAGRVLLILGCQATAVLALFLYVNNANGFYTSWSDLLGVSSPAEGPGPIAVVQPGSGTVEQLRVDDSSGTGHDLLVWLPPGYDAKRLHKYPVLMFLPGYRNSAAGVFNQYDFGTVASHLVSDGKVPAFVAVFAPIMIDAGRDTECVDVRGGPQAESWISTIVPEAVVEHYHVEEPGKHWAAMGWSTGGECAAKLALKFPTRFSTGTSFGGNYRPYLDRTTGDLFGGDKQFENENSVLWLYQTYGTRGTHLLLVAGKQDPDAWPDAKAMAKAIGDDPHVQLITFPTGGHNFHNYAGYLEQALLWVASAGSFG